MLKVQILSQITISGALSCYNLSTVIWNTVEELNQYAADISEPRGNWLPLLIFCHQVRAGELFEIQISSEGHGNGLLDFEGLDYKNIRKGLLPEMKGHPVWYSVSHSGPPAASEKPTNRRKMPSCLPPVLCCSRYSEA